MKIWQYLVCAAFIASCQAQDSVSPVRQQQTPSQTGKLHEHQNHSKSSPISTPSPPGAWAYIISPKHGEVLYNPVTIRFGVTGMGIAPMGEPVENTGHFHIWLDEELPPWDQPLVFGDHFLHYSQGETQVTLDLSPGEHTIQLIMADHAHMPHNPPVYSEKILVTVIPYPGERK